MQSVAAAWTAGADVCTRFCVWGRGDGDELGAALKLGEEALLGLGDGLGAGMSLGLGWGASLGLGALLGGGASLGLGDGLGASLGLGSPFAAALAAFPDEAESTAGSVAVGSFVAAEGVTVARWAEADTGRMTLKTSVRTTTRRRPARVWGVLRRFIGARSLF